MSVLGDVGQRIAAALTPLAGPLVLRVDSADHQAKGWEEAVEVSSTGMLTTRDRAFCILAAGLPVQPAPGQRLIVGAESLNIQNVAGDGTGAVWRITARK